jgi:ADP-ribosyl-[dinitrogen reductase] hydrolase
MQPKERFRGCLLGLACGDAVGAAVEFRPRGSFPAVSDMIGGGPFHLKPGEWTDDTSMALCLASSLVELDRFDARDQMERYCRWWRDGYWSSTGRCFDIGNTTAAALRTLERTRTPQPPSAARSPARSTANPASPATGATASRCARRSFNWRIVSGKAPAPPHM